MEEELLDDKNHSDATMGVTGDGICTGLQGAAVCSAFHTGFGNKTSYWMRITPLCLSQKQLTFVDTTFKARALFSFPARSLGHTLCRLDVLFIHHPASPLEGPSTFMTLW